MDQNYVPLSLFLLRPNVSLTFNVYIEINDKQVLFVRSGDAIGPDRLDKLIKKDVNRLNIDIADECNLFTFVEQETKRALEEDSVDLDEKNKIISGAVATAVEGMQVNPDNVNTYKITKSASKGLRDLIEQKPDVLKKMFDKKCSERGLLTKHSQNVSAFCVKLGKKLKFNEEQLDNIGVAGLLHDLGISKLPGDLTHLFRRPLQNMTPGDRRVYLLHAKDSADMLSGKKYINPEIVELVLNHEETLGGRGPLCKKKLQLPIQLLSMVNVYDKRVTCFGMTPIAALKDMKIVETGHYDLKLLQHLKVFLDDEGFLK